jgi:anti-sigma B factor antagonist
MPPKPPDLGLEIHQADGVTVVRFTTAELADELKIWLVGDHLLGLMEGMDRPRFLLNFSGVYHFSSSMLGKLIVLHKKAAAAKGRLVLCAVAPELFKVFEETRLDQVLTFFPGEAEALQSLQA